MEAAMVWEWPIFIDLWAAGVAGGGFFAAFLVNRFTGGRHKNLMKIATWVGVPLALLGVLLLVLDLGNQLSFWHLIVSFYPLSPMSIGTFVMAAWSACGTALLVLWLAESGVTGFVLLRPLVPLAKILSWISFVLSPLVVVYTGVLLSNTNQPMWTTMLLPVLFVVSAIFTGVSATRLVATLLGRETPGELGKASLILAALQAVALIGFLVTVPADILVSGALALWFWVGVVLVGLVVPAVLEFLALKSEGATPLVMVSTLCVLVGGLALRAVVAIGGQM